MSREKMPAAQFKVARGVAGALHTPGKVTDIRWKYLRPIKASTVASKRTQPEKSKLKGDKIWERQWSGLAFKSFQ